MSGIINGGGDNDSLLNDVKKYIDLNIDYLKVAGTEKLAIILSSIAVVAAVMILGGIALFYISFSGVYLIESWVGSRLPISLWALSCSFSSLLSMPSA